MNKKGYTMASLGPLAIMLVVAAIIVAMGGQILNEVSNEVDTGNYVYGTNGTAAFNSTGGGLEGVAQFSEWFDTISLILVAAVVIGIIVTSFGME